MNSGLKNLRIIYSFNACFEVPSGIHDGVVSFLIPFLKVALITAYFQTSIYYLEADISSSFRTGVLRTVNRRVCLGH
jgi:hypothetical protein